MLYIVDIHGEIEGDYEIISEYDPRKVYLPHVTNEYLKRFKLAFNEKNCNWQDEAGYNELWLDSMMSYFNDLLQVTTLMTMNDLIYMLGFERVEYGFDMVFEKGDKLEYTAVKRFGNEYILTFNLSNN